MQATIQIKLTPVVIGRLCRMGYLSPLARDPGAIRAAVTAALADRLAPAPTLETAYLDAAR